MGSATYFESLSAFSTLESATYSPMLSFTLQKKKNVVFEVSDTGALQL